MKRLVLVLTVVALVTVALIWWLRYAVGALR